MDIDEVRNTNSPLPKLPDDLQSVHKAQLLPIKQRAGSLEDYYRWNIRDRVTISSEAKRRYNKMKADGQYPE